MSMECIVKIIHCIGYNNLIWYFVMLKYWKTTGKRKPIHDYQGNIYSKTFYLHYRHINKGWNFSSSIKYTFLGGRTFFSTLQRLTHRQTFLYRKKLIQVTYPINIILYFITIYYTIYMAQIEKGANVVLF